MNVSTMYRDKMIFAARRLAFKQFHELAESMVDHFNFESTIQVAKSVFIDLIYSEVIERGHGESGAFEIASSSWDRIHAEFINECRDDLAAIQKRHAVNRIRAVQAKCIIEPVVAGAALPYCLEFQKYRTKIMILLDKSHHFEFYVKYRDLDNERIIQGIPEMIRRTAEFISDYGPQVSLKTNDDHINWIRTENSPSEM